MDRRKFQRKHIANYAYLSSNTSPRQRCEAVNISGDGVFLKTRPLPLRPGAVVELVVPLESQSVVKLRRVRGLIARTDKHGIGVKMLRRMY